MKREALRHLPDEDLGVLRGRGDDTVIEGVPEKRETASSRSSDIARPTDIELMQTAVRKPSRKPWTPDYGLRTTDCKRTHVPVRIKHGSRVSPEKRDLVGKLAPFIEGDDSKGAAAAGLPVDRDELWVDLYKAVSAYGTVRSPSLVACDTVVSPGGPMVRTGVRGWSDGAHLHQISVPGISADVQVVVAKLLARRFPKDVAWRQ